MHTSALVCPVILGTNFMEKHAVEIDFKQKQVKVQDNVITAQEEPVTNERCTVHNGHTTWENHYSATMTLPDTDPAPFLSPSFLPCHYQCSQQLLKNCPDILKVDW